MITGRGFHEVPVAPALQKTPACYGNGPRVGSFQGPFGPPRQLALHSMSMVLLRPKDDDAATNFHSRTNLPQLGPCCLLLKFALVVFLLCFAEAALHRPINSIAAPPRPKPIQSSQAKRAFLFIDLKNWNHSRPQSYGGRYLRLPCMGMMASAQQGTSVLGITKRSRHSSIGSRSRHKR